MRKLDLVGAAEGVVPGGRQLTRREGGLLQNVAVRVVSVSLLVLGLAGALTGTATAAEGTLSPSAAKGIVLGLIDATGPLAVQCGMGRIGERIKAGNVATAAVKDSLALSGAKKSCSGVKNMVEGIGAILLIAEAGRPVYIALNQSAKNKWWSGGLVKTCNVTLRVGASSALAKNFKASFTCR